MASAYVAPYIVAGLDTRMPTGATRLCEEFVRAARAGEWPYDVCDDPAFFSARRLGSRGGALTWGICRPNLRSPLRVGDVVAFVGFQSSGRDVEYRFCGYATVARKVSQLDVWSDDGLAVYRSYLNLLARLDGDRFIHEERHPRRPHDDWLWRMTERKGKRWHKSDFAAYSDPRGGMAVQLEVDTANGYSIELAANYVIFERDLPLTYLIDDPPLVATRETGDLHETWLADDFAQRLNELMLGRQHPGSCRGALHVSNGANPHPHLRLAADGEQWRAQLGQLLHEANRTPAR